MATLCFVPGGLARALWQMPGPPAGNWNCLPASINNSGDSVHWDVQYAVRLAFTSLNVAANGQRIVNTLFTSCCAE